MSPSKFLSPTECFESLKSNKANDFFKLEQDLNGKPAVAMMNSNFIKKFVCSKNEDVE